jgi:hypothetical protein
VSKLSNFDAKLNIASDIRSRVSGSIDVISDERAIGQISARLTYFSEVFSHIVSMRLRKFYVQLTETLRKPSTIVGG